MGVSSVFVSLLPAAEIYFHFYFTARKSGRSSSKQ